LKLFAEEDWAFWIEIPHPPGGCRPAALFLPVLMMFWFAYGLMNRSIDKWFSRPVGK